MTNTKKIQGVVVGVVVATVAGMWAVRGVAAGPAGAAGAGGAGHGHDHAAAEKVSKAVAEPGKDAHGHDHSKEQGADPHAGHDHGAPAKAGAAGGKEPAAGDGHVDEVKLTADAVREYAIGVDEVAVRRWTPRVVVPGRVVWDAEAVAHVGIAVSGRVSELRVRVGDVVKKGDVLLEVESAQWASAQAEYLLKKSAAESAGAGVESLRRSFERAKALYDKQQGMALGEVQKREGEYLVAQAAVDAAKAQVKVAGNTLKLMGMSAEAVEALEKTGEMSGRVMVIAPVPGQVVEREVTLGEMVSPEKEALVVLADPGKLWVVAEVPEGRLGEVSVGNSASVRTGDAKSAAAKVALVGAQVDPQTRTGRVRLEIQTPDAGLRPGMFASAEIALTTSEAGQEVVAVPEAAVLVVEGKASVFVPVEGEANTFAKRNVEVGLRGDGFVIVRSGLVAGEKVVTRGAFILKAELGKSGAAHEH